MAKFIHYKMEFLHLLFFSFLFVKGVGVWERGLVGIWKIHGEELYMIRIEAMD